MAQAREAAQGLACSAWLGQALVAEALAQRAQGHGEGAQASLREAIEQFRKAAGDEAPAGREAMALLTRS